MDRGRIIEEGSHDQLIRLKGGLYRRLFERQALELTKGLTQAEMLADGARALPPRADDEDQDEDETSFAFGK
jgi:ATP-binding cassette, subfamily B, bacterial